MPHRPSIVVAAAALFFVPAAFAQHQFVFEDPEVDFEVLDMNPFDGFGDNGPYPTYNTVGLGTTGDDREMAEFDLLGFEVPEGEEIVKATFEVQITSVQVWGLGVEVGNTPDILAVYGYIGNGQADLSDFEAGIRLDAADTSNPYVGQIVSFDVTEFARSVVAAGERWLGTAVRGEEVGLMAIYEGNGFPRLVIETAPASGCYADFDGNGVLNLFDFLAYTGAFNAGDTSADCDQSGALNLFDFLCFTAAFNAGC